MENRRDFYQYVPTTKITSLKIGQEVSDVTNFHLVATFCVSKSPIQALLLSMLIVPPGNVRTLYFALAFVSRRIRVIIDGESGYVIAEQCLN